MPKRILMLVGDFVEDYEVMVPFQMSYNRMPPRFIMVLFCMIPLFSFNATGQDSVQARIIFDRTGQVHPWSNLGMNDDPDNFQFAIVTDRTGGHRAGVFMDAIRKINLLQPEFVMSVGDLIEGYTTDKKEIRREWDEFNGYIDSLDMPFFYVPGNHDYINPEMAAIWKDLYGPSYYHFIYKDVLFLCLNSEEAMRGSDLGGIEKPQFEYVKKVLAENRDVRWTLVFMHQPLWLYDNTGYWKDIEALLEKRRHTVFVGHKHHYVKYERNNGKYIMLATTGGTSSLRGPNFGEFDHVAWVTMTDKGPVLANLILQGIWDENVVTENLQLMTSREYIRIDPVISDNGTYRGGTFSVRISNDEDYPMRIALKFDAHPVLVPEVIEYQKQIEPNSVEVLDIPINVIRPVSIDKLSPITLYSHILFILESGREIDLNSSYGLLPVERRMVRPATSEIIVDGRMNEWSGYPYKCNSLSPRTGDKDGYTGDFDASYEFNMSWDDQYLYLALSIWDDKVVSGWTNTFWNQDAVRLLLDARPFRESANGRGNDAAGDFLRIEFALPATKIAPVLFRDEANLPEGLLVKAKKTLQGADVEIGIPMEYIEKMNGKDWEEFRLNMAYLDYDGDGSQTILWWRPEWGSASNFVGSGMFFRENH